MYYEAMVFFHIGNQNEANYLVLGANFSLNRKTNAKRCIICSLNDEIHRCMTDADRWILRLASLIGSTYTDGSISIPIQNHEFLVLHRFLISLLFHSS